MRGAGPRAGPAPPCPTITKRHRRGCCEAQLPLGAGAVPRLAGARHVSTSERRELVVAAAQPQHGGYRLMVAAAQPEHERYGWHRPLLSARSQEVKKRALI